MDDETEELPVVGRRPRRRGVTTRMVAAGVVFAAATTIAVVNVALGVTGADSETAPSPTPTVVRATQTPTPSPTPTPTKTPPPHRRQR